MSSPSLSSSVSTDSVLYRNKKNQKIWKYIQPCEQGQALSCCNIETIDSFGTITSSIPLTPYPSSLLHPIPSSEKTSNNLQTLIGEVKKDIDAATQPFHGPTSPLSTSSPSSPLSLSQRLHLASKYLRALKQRNRVENSGNNYTASSRDTSFTSFIERSGWSLGQYHSSVSMGISPDQSSRSAQLLSMNQQEETEVTQLMTEITTAFLQTTEQVSSEYYFHLCSMSLFFSSCLSLFLLLH